MEQAVRYALLILEITEPQLGGKLVENVSVRFSEKSFQQHRILFSVALRIKLPSEISSGFFGSGFTEAKPRMYKNA
jgi:hypothetical protein